jgi:paraquat-inducible protein A
MQNSDAPASNSVVSHTDTHNQNSDEYIETVKNCDFVQGSASSHGLACCRTCHNVAPVTLGHCPRCDDRLYLRKPNSIQRTLALIITAMLFYIPANIYPIMSTTLLGEATPSTIFSGVVLFLEHGSYFVAFVIFAASVLIPLAKMLVILWLCYTTARHSRLSRSELTKLYQITEFVGKWSMIDIFVVAILVALVQVTGIMMIEPGIAARAFAIVVILTMLAAHQFDVRLIWDKQER